MLARRDHETAADYQPGSFLVTSESYSSYSYFSARNRGCRVLGEFLFDRVRYLNCLVFEYTKLTGLVVESL